MCSRGRRRRREPPHSSAADIGDRGARTRMPRERAAMCSSENVHVQRRVRKNWKIRGVDHQAPAGRSSRRPRNHLPWRANPKRQGPSTPTRPPRFACDTDSSARLPPPGSSSTPCFLQRNSRRVRNGAIVGAPRMPPTMLPSHCKVVVEIGGTVRGEKDQRRDSEDHAAGHRLAGRSNGLDDVVFEDGRATESS